ncbi:MAG: 6-phosphofructokinase [Methanobacteriota archaeon]
MRVGILCGGGDAPGTNAVVRAIVRKGIIQYGHDLVGVRDGWRGMLEGELIPLDLDAISGIIYRGGTILGTSRTNPFKREGGPQKILENMKKFSIDALVAIGGDDTLGAAQKMFEIGLPCVGVPKTIDNDLACTEYTFGFNTAVSIVTDALDRLHTTAESHNRVMVVEVMGRHTGWIALEAGLAGGADFILIPEKPVDIEEVCGCIKKRQARGRNFSIVVVAEGAKLKGGTEVVYGGEVDEFGHVRLGGIGYLLGKEIEKNTGLETRVVILGHLQRGGSPTAFDRILGTKFGLAAIDLVANGKFGLMPSLCGKDIVSVSIKDAVNNRKTVDPKLYELASVFFG